MDHPCHLCGAAFKQIAKLKSHLILHEEEKTYKCEFCEKLFSKSSNLYSHIRTHTGEKPFQCKVCSRLFPRLHNVRSHLVKVHKVDKTEAEQLILATDKDTKKEYDKGVKYIKTEPLEDSLLSPNTSTPVCNTDNGAIVKDLEYYTVHTGTVTYCDDLGVSQENEAKKLYYKCKTCCKTLSHKSNMEDHVRSHTGIKLFKCRLCGKGLSRKQNLVHHLRHVHYTESSHIEKNIIRMNDSVMGKKVRRKIYRESELETSALETSLGEICSTSKTVTDIAEQLNSVSGREDGGEKEASSHFKIESGESECQAPLTDKASLRMETDRDSDDTISITSAQGESSDRIQSKYFISETQFSPGGCVKPDIHEVKSEMEVKPDPKNETPFLFTETDVSDMTEVKEDNPEGSGLKFTTLQDIGDDTAEEDDASLKAESTEQLACDQDSEQMYIILNPDNPSLKMYKCRLCGFECKRRYYMAVEHTVTHLSYRPYLCVVCCKPYSRKYTLRCHLIKEHKIIGPELKEILATTGSKVEGGLPQSYKGKVNSTSGFDNSLYSEDFKTDGESDNLDNSKTTEDIRLLGINETEQKQKCKTAERTDVNEENAECSGTANTATSQEGEPNKGNTGLDTCTSGSNSQGENAEKSMCLDIKTPESEGALNVPESPMSAPGSLPSFFTSVYNMINSRGPKRPCQFNEKIKECMDLKTMTCLKCHKRCSNKSNLKQHIKFVHIKEKEFSCFVCGKKFNTKFNLKIHWKQHGNLLDDKLKEEFACKKCGKEFTTKSYLKVHIVNKHGVFHGGSDDTTETTGNTSMDPGESV